MALVATMFTVPAAFAGTELRNVETNAICVGTCFGWTYSPNWSITQEYVIQGTTTKIGRTITTPEIYFPCSGCAPTMFRGFVTARKLGPTVRVQLGQDIPSVTPSVRLGYAYGPGGIAAENGNHVSSGADCCVAAWTNPRFIHEEDPGALGVQGFIVRQWVSFRLSNGSLLGQTTLSNATGQAYIDDGPAIGAGTCVGSGCGGV